ncbi:dedA protein [Paenibacillus mucilaginosus 3016]|uniref:DedA protein n=1 Tax=Paenibacillus mucilaginosus 3016 TaxID=1116391 RepID=H6NSS8_9BACL|nr:DedA family protein [Paenibacillus mucilaginosus]AFC27018.1 dedA protein [Paenibacillus mucilaginosus 3016]WFA15954.1 DedA family protein [Paenibacillus mucilaginosus]
METITIDTLLSYIHQFGYLALFFALWLGIVGMPIPDEVVVMTGGMVGALHLLSPLPAFVITYVGVVSGLTLGYVLGRVMGPPVLERLRKKKSMEPYIEKSYAMLDKYGSGTLVFSYFLPVVRHLVPYLVGINGMSYRTYALYSYLTGLLWTMVYFVLGYFFGDSIEVISRAVTRYGWYVLALLAAGGLAVMWLRPLRQKAR